MYSNCLALFKGAYSAWGEWGTCTGTECQTGTRTRTRTCPGPHACTGDATETDNTCTVPVADPSCGKQKIRYSSRSSIYFLYLSFSAICDTDYPGNAVADGTKHPMSGVASAAACQALCVAESDCTHFTFSTSNWAGGAAGNCWLKTAAAAASVTGLISGPKTC